MCFSLQVRACVHRLTAPTRHKRVEVVVELSTNIRDSLTFMTCQVRLLWYGEVRLSVLPGRGGASTPGLVSSHTYTSLRQPHHTHYSTSLTTPATSVTPNLAFPTPAIPSTSTSLTAIYSNHSYH